MKTILVDAVDAFVIEGEGIFQPLMDLLESYPNPKIILTNANDAQMEQYGLIGLPYPVFTLKHLPDKVDPEYFRKMLETYGLSSNNVVYFEHNADAVKSAQSVGITAFHYDAEARDVAGVKKFLDENL